MMAKDVLILLIISSSFPPRHTLQTISAFLTVFDQWLWLSAQQNIIS